MHTRESERPFLLVQSRPEVPVADGEFEAFVRYGGFRDGELRRVHVDRGELPAVDLDDWAGILVGGGPANFAASDDAKPAAQRAYEAWLIDLAARCAEHDHPYLGACLGLGALTHALGGAMSFSTHEPVAPVSVHVLDDRDLLLAGFPTTFMAFGGHKEGLAEPLDRMRLLARSAHAVHLVGVGEHVYATQFHPELDAVGLEQRIRAYDGYGYFDSDERDALIEAGHEVTATWPMEFLRRWVVMARRHSAAR